jgi:hypothetical protein
MAGAAVAPFLAPYLSVALEAGETAGRATLPLEELYALAEPVGGSAGAGSILFGLTDPLRFALEDPLLALWIAATASTLLLFLGASLLLRGRARRWPRHRLGGEDVLVSPATGPAVLGVFRPRIVLPAWAASRPSRELEMILLHEREHRKARDPALLAVGIAFLAAAPWNAALWWMLSRLRLAVEGDCDARVLARGVPRRPYGSLLLEVASGTRGPFPLTAMLAEGRRSSLERRLEMMRRNVRKHRWTGALAAVLAGGFFLALACETPTPPGTDEDGEWTVEEVEYPLVAEGVTVEPATGSPLYQRIDTMEAARTRITPDTVTLEGGVRVVLAPADGTVDAEARNAAPLVFIDDEPAGRMTDLESLDALDIERIEIVKGKAAVAIWGEEARHGVVKIYLKGK